MRILASENLPGGAIAALPLNGHDVVWIREDLPGSFDIQVLERAQDDNRIIITFDKDYGELAFRYGLPATCGIILFRISKPSYEHIANLSVAALNQRDDWAGHFSVIEDTRIRMKPLPNIDA